MPRPDSNPNTFEDAILAVLQWLNCQLFQQA